MSFTIDNNSVCACLCLCLCLCLVCAFSMPDVRVRAHASFRCLMCACAFVRMRVCACAFSMLDVRKRACACSMPDVQRGSARGGREGGDVRVAVGGEKMSGGGWRGGGEAEKRWWRAGREHGDTHQRGVRGLGRRGCSQRRVVFTAPSSPMYVFTPVNLLFRCVMFG